MNGRTSRVAALLACALAIGLLPGCASRPLVFGTSTRIPAYAREDAERQLVVTIRDSEPGLDTAPGATPRTYGAGVGYQASAYARRISDAIASEYGLAWVAEWRIDVLGVHCVVFRARDAAEQSEILKRLRSDRRIETAQPMNRFDTTSGGSAYNDPYFPLQANVEAMRIPEAHRWARGRGVRVAVIDTGVDFSHPDLGKRVQLARNFVDDDAASFQRDAHGTAVAGIVAAAMNNGLGIVGVAPEVKLIALKACWHTPQPGGAASCNTLTLAEAIAFALEARAAVINLSLTGPDDPLLTRLVEVALRRGVIVVAARPKGAAGAESFPIGIPGVLGVADADVTVDAASGGQLRAPGREILTLVPDGGYDYLSGVSLSTAMVSGVVALLLERDPALTPARIRALLEQTASLRALAGAGTYRLVNACSALASVMHEAKCPEDGSKSVGKETTPVSHEARLR